jgi:hypothetical protein
MRMLPPIVHPPRKVPVAIKERLRNELERLTKMDIIKPTKYLRFAKIR